MHYTALMCAAQRGIRVDVFARILFQQVAVKHLKEVELAALGTELHPGWHPCGVRSPSSVLEPPQRPELEEDSVALVLAMNSPCC